MKKKTLYYSTSLVAILNDYKSRGVSYIDTLIELHDISDIEFDDLIEMLPDYIIKKIKKDFINKKYRIKLNKEEEKIKKIQEIKKNSNILDFLKLKK